MRQQDIDVTSEVRITAGAPLLYIDGQPVPGTAYITYFTENNRYADFAGAGIRLYTMPVFFARRTINERNNFPLFGEGIFDTDEPDFTIFDREIGKILEARPDAWVFPRVNVNTTKKWDDAHPDEQCDFGYIDRRTCFSSDLWLEEVKRMLGLFIKHVQNAPYARNVIGYQIAGGNTEEWFSFDQKGSVGLRSREKFAEVCAKYRLEGSEEEYYIFLSEIAAHRICQLAEFTKELTERRLVVGSFYGYTFECPFRTSNHHALHRVLRCPDIDFLCSPASYAGKRITGRDISNMLPIDSVKLHGKLYYSENDTRTHLTKFCCDNPKYTTPIWLGYDCETTLEVMKMQLARQITHGHASWWFDMWGGWYADERYMKLISDGRELLERSIGLPGASAAPLAVIIDERSYAKLPEGVSGHAVGSAIREALGLSGVPYDAYLASDLDAVREMWKGGRYKALVFLIPAETPAMDRCIEAAESDRVKYLRITPENAGISPAELREFCRSCGIKPLTDRDAVVYENESFIYVNAPADGEYELHTDSELCDAFTGEKCGNTLTLAALHGKLMRKR